MKVASARDEALPSFFRQTSRSVISGVAVLLLLLESAEAASLKVRVRDARDNSALAGAFVQVGPVPGNPFAGNNGTTAADGTITFADANLSGVQTVTAAAAGYARLTLVDGALDSVTLSLHPEIPDTTIYGPKAEITGTVLNISILNNDGNLDIGVVYPAVQISDLLGSGSLPIEAPEDTLNFPIIGQAVLPGNVVIPTQTEALFLQFSKPVYHFFVQDQKTYHFLVVAGRLPIASLLAPDVTDMTAAMVMREIGIEHQIAVNGGRSLNINSDLNLTNNLTIAMPEAPAGSEMRVLSLADVPEPEGLVTIFFDNKTAIAGQTGSILLSGMNPDGDLSGAVPFLFGSYHDSSDANAWESGRLDRTPLVLPASRTISDFYLLPELTQNGDAFSWSDVMRPGITPNPTWTFGSIRLAPISPTDSTVTDHVYWEVITPAGRGSFVLPVLPSGAPGGIGDPDATPEADRLAWEHLISDPSGSIQEIMDGGLSSVTRFSRRNITITRAVSAVGDPRPTTPRLEFEPAAPNPFHHRTRFTYTIREAGVVRLDVFDLQGRRIRTLASRSLSAGTYSTDWDGFDEVGRRVRPGVYFARMSAAGETHGRQVVVR